ncbi:hypothetical protein BOW53_10655 [Solemya pervernicosa gill symbiont]|uniref:Segregation and condensation protein A n=2 Tax=Gammaproteobacteria incertae sedis TaxID=118884 RepID=A0A1T2L3Z7_9GAMM|nr:hypothetical protein [Candidatus Reidiella endopervernicosa]OOZ39666.1 hypothetical protein BOW53_10655 [Solemya pervernicosa gill symbiont]QKQ27752.1 segregation and condensation protein A [Candidatus Reidiella endopervernicosa]
MSEQELSKEEQILKSVKGIVTRVIKETATPPGMAHPLSEQTINDMREALLLISLREQELAKAAGRSMDMRPRYTDEPQQGSGEVVVPLHKTGQVTDKGES